MVILSIKEPKKAEKREQEYLISFVLTMPIGQQSFTLNSTIPQVINFGLKIPYYYQDHL